MIAALLAQSNAPAQPNLIASLIPFLLIGGLMYFMLIRPQKRRVADQRAMIDSIEVGDEVLTIGGIFGIVRAIDDELDEITLEVAPGVTIRVTRSAVARRVTEDEDDWGAEEEAGDEASGEEA